VTSREAEQALSCPHCKSQRLTCVGLVQEITFFRCDDCDQVLEAHRPPLACDIHLMPAKKPERPKREDAAQSAFWALQQVIETTEGKKPAPKRKPR